MFKQIILSTALLAASTAVLAQSRPAAAPAKAPAATAPALTPEQQAAVQKQDTQMAQAALQVAQMVDAGKVGDVWDAASPVAKGVVGRDVFVQSVNADRAKVGKLVERKLAGITRSFSDGKTAGAKGAIASPAGYYINVNFATRFANEKQPIRELISFHLDQDKTWRVSGYTLR